MSRTKVLVCGASGFIGRNIFESFSKVSDFDVYGTYLSRKFSDSSNLFRANLTKREDVESVFKGMDFVVYCAAVTDGLKVFAKEPTKYITDNIIMHTLLTEAAYRYKIKHFIFMSCTIMYPPVSDRPVKESDMFSVDQVQTVYLGAAPVKVLGENLCRYYAGLGGKFTVVRHSNTYGPHDKFSIEKGHVLASTVVKVLTQDKVNIASNGLERRDFLYVDDLVSFLLKAIERQESNFEIFNVGRGCSITIRELVNKIKSATGEDEIKVEFAETPGLENYSTLDISKATDLLGWSPKMKLEDGLKLAIAWYKRNRRIC